MKRLAVRALAAALILLGLLSMVSAAGVQRESGLTLSDDLTLERTYYSYDKDGTLKEQLLTYTPGGDVMPLVVYGDTLYGRSTMDYLEEYLSDQGYTAVGAVNAAFFDMSTGIPYGMVVTDGILRTSGNVLTVGISEDGDVTIGTPNLKVTMEYVGGETEISYNKALTKSNGYCLYSQDYDYVTKNSLDGYYLVLEADEDYLTTDCTLEATVVEIEADVSRVDIPEDGFVLGLAMDTDYSSAMASVKKMEVATPSPSRPPLTVTGKTWPMPWAAASCWWRTAAPSLTSNWIPPTSRWPGLPWASSPTATWWSIPWTRATAPMA